MVTVVSFGTKPTISLRNMGATATVRPYGEKGDKGDDGLPGPNSVPADTAVGTYANTDGSFTANGIDARIDKRMPFTTAEMHGAMADGTSSTPTDNLAALQAGVNALAAAGGGRMICSKGLYGFKGVLVVKNGVYIEGPVTRQAPAMTATPSTPGLLALDGTAQLQVGDWTSSSNPGGVTNLYVDGNKVGAASTAKTGLVRLAGVSTEIRGLFVHRSGGDGIVVDGLQNSTIVGGFSVGHAGAALVLDNGCGGLSFTGGYYGTSKGGTHLCRDTAGQANLYPFGPTNITFTGTMFESYGGQPAPLDEPHARHVHISGRNLTYVGCNFTGGAQNTAAATVLVDDTVTGGIPSTVSFDNCIYWARGGYDVVRIAGNSSVAFVGRQESSDDGTNHAASFVCVDGGFPHVAMVGEVLMAGDVDGDLIWRAINSGSMLGTYADQSGGQVYRLNADQSLGIRATGDTINKFQLEGNGTIRWTDGSGGAIAPHTDGLLVAGRTIFSDGVAIVGDTISVTTAAQSVALDAKTAVEWRLSFAATGDGVSALTVANALEGSRLRVGLFGTGVNTMTWATNMSFASTAPQPVDGQAIFVDFEYVATASKWMETGRSTAVADDTEVAALVSASGSATHAALSATYAAPIIVQPGDDMATKWAAASTAGRDLVIMPGTYAITTGLTWQSYKHSVTGMGDVTLDFTGMSSGYAVTVRGVGSLGNDYNHRALNKIQGIRFLGPDTDATTVDCFLFEEATGNNLDSAQVQGCNIFGFRDQLVYGNNVWAIKFDNVNFAHFHRYGVDFKCTTNAGEQFTFNHCRWLGGTNAGGTATAINTDLSAQFLDVAIFGGSMDYNNIDFEHRSGTLSFFGTHFENSNTTPMGYLSYTASNARTVLNMFSPEIYPTEAYASARDHCFEIRSTSGGGVHYTLSGVTARFFDRNTWLIKNLSGTTPSNSSVRGNNIDFSVGTDGVGKVSNDTDLLITGDMNGGVFLGTAQQFGGWWRQGTVTYSFDSTVKKEGANSLKMVGDGTAATTGAGQLIRVNAGTRYLITGYYRIDALTAGSTDIQFRQYSIPAAGSGIPAGAAGTQSSLVTNMLNLAANTSSLWVPFSKVIATQNWAAIGSLQFNNNNLNGTIYLDDWHVWEIS